MASEQRADKIQVEVATSTAAENGSGQDAASVVITDRDAQRAWSGQGSTASEAATEAVRRLLGDRRVREYT